MRTKNGILKKLVIVAFAATCAVSATTAAAASGSAYAEQRELYLGGFAAGFMLDTSEVEVVGLCDVLTESGLVSPARSAGIKTGDIIAKINGAAVTSGEDVDSLLSAALKSAVVTLVRDGQELNVKITPAKDATSGKMRMGVLVKDSLSGVGTVTYIDKTDGKFASLGHPVTNSDGDTIEINGGTLCGCVIYDVKKGVRGTPGELKGAFESSKLIGDVVVNSSSGVFGTLSAEYDTSSLVKIAAGDIDEVTPGRAQIYTTISANEIRCYDISIVKVDKSNSQNRNYVIKIDDEELIEATGGIVQGMSGSPIVQNGKLVGAVTHVFINDPTRGYGISIENMLASQ